MFFTWHVTTFYVFLIIRLGLWAPLWLSWKRSTFSEEDLSSFPGLGRSPGEGKGYPLQYSGLKNAMDHLVHGVMLNIFLEKSKVVYPSFDLNTLENVASVWRLQLRLICM